MMALTPARALCNPNEIMLIQECYTLGSLTVMERLSCVSLYFFSGSKGKPLIFNYYQIRKFPMNGCTEPQETHVCKFMIIISSRIVLGNFMAITV